MRQDRGEAGESSPGESTLRAPFNCVPLSNSAAETLVIPARHRPAPALLLKQRTSHQRPPSERNLLLVTRTSWHFGTSTQKLLFSIIVFSQQSGDSQRRRGFAKPTSAPTNRTQQAALENPSAALREGAFGLALKLHRAELTLFDPGRTERGNCMGNMVIWGFFCSYITALESLLRIHY